MMTPAELHGELTNAEPSGYASSRTEPTQEARGMLIRALSASINQSERIDAHASAGALVLRLHAISTIFFPYSAMRDIAIFPNPLEILHIFSDDTVRQLLPTLQSIADLPGGGICTDCLAIDDWLDLVQSDVLTLNSSSDQDTALGGLRAAYSAIVRQDPVSAAVRQLNREIRSTRDSARQAKEYAEAARQAAGEAGENALISYFETHAKAAGWKATILAACSVAALIFAMAIGWLVVKDAHELSTGIILGRLSLTLPLFGVAAYLGRLGGHFRDSARWAGTAKVQLQSISAFVATIDDVPSRDEVRKILGRRVFSSPDFGNTGSNDTDTVGALQAAADMVGKLKA